MEYHTFSPSAVISPFIKCYWTLEAPAEEGLEKQRIVPDGCMEMIFHFAGLYRQFLPGGGSIEQPRSFVFGQVSAPLEIQPTGDTGIFAARFRPEGFIPFATMPLEDMENTAVPLQLLYGSAGELLEKEILSATATTQRINILESYLLQRLQSPAVIDNAVKACVDLMLGADGQLKVAGLSEALNINRRQLERRFASEIGLSPKQLSKIIRLQTTLKALLQGEDKTLTDLAHESEYYDQAHFIKDFKAFTGVSPKHFYAGSLRFSKLFTGME